MTVENLFPRDFHPEAVKSGNRWMACYTVPWMHNHVLRDPVTKEVQRFDTELEAFKAATAMMCRQFRDKTRGWKNAPGIGITAEIEKVFGKGNCSDDNGPDGHQGKKKNRRISPRSRAPAESGLG